MDFQESWPADADASTQATHCAVDEAGEPTVIFHPINNDLTHTPTGKRYHVASDGTWIPRSAGHRGYGTYEIHRAQNRSDFFELVRRMATSGAGFMLLGVPSNEPDAIAWRRKVREATGIDIIRRTKNEKPTAKMLRSTGLQIDPPMLVEVPRRGYMIDIDPTDAMVCDATANGINLYENPRAALDLFRCEYLPVEIRNSHILMHLSGSAGKNGDGANVRAHVFVWLSQAMWPKDFKTYLAAHNREQLHLCEQQRNGQNKGPCDLALYQAAQPHFIADPEFLNCADPIKERWFEFKGNCFDVELDIRTEATGTLLERQAAAKRGTTLKDRRVIRRPSGEPVDLDRQKRRPRTVEECLKSIGDDKDGFHNPINAVTWRQAEQDHMHGTTPEQGAKFVQRVRTTVRAADRGNRSFDEICSYANDVKRRYADAYDKVEAKAAARRAQSGVVPAPREVERLPRDQVLNDVEAKIGEFIEDVTRWLIDEYHVAEKYAAGGWSANLIPPPHLHLKGETGSGKTRAMVGALLRSRLLKVSRVYFVVANYDRANALAEEFVEQASRLGVERLPRITGFKGHQQEGMCNAEVGSIAHQRMQTLLKGKGAGSSHVSASEWACAVCPFKKSGCNYHDQFTKSGPAFMPGVNIIVNSYLGADRIPGITEDRLPDFLDPESKDECRAYGQRKVDAFKNPGSGPAPISSLFIDEQYDGALWHRGVLHVGRSIPKSSTEARRMADAEPHMIVLRQLCDDAMSTKGQITKHSMRRLGLIEVAETDDGLCAWPKDSYWEFFLSINRYSREAEYRVSQCLDKNPKAAEISDTNLKDALVERENARQQQALLQLIRQQLHHDHNEILGATISVTNGGSTSTPEYDVHLEYLKPIDEALSLYPTLYADATMDEKLAEIPYATLWPRVGPDGEYYETLESTLDFKGYRFKEIRAVKPHMSVLKVVGAPTSKGELTGTIRDGKRCERDSSIERISRLQRYVAERCGPNENGQPSVGLIGNKAVAEYFRQHGNLPPWAKVRHYNAVTGSNEYKDARVISTIGQTRPPPEVFARETNGYFAMAKDCPQLELTEAPIRNTMQAIETVDGNGREVPALGCPDEMGNRRLKQIYAAPVMQAADRGRGLHASVERPLLVIDMSFAALEEQHSAAIHWQAFADISELDIMAAGAGLFIPGKPSLWMKAFPGLFADKKRAANYSSRMLAEHANKYPKILIGLDIYKSIKSMSKKRHFLNCPPIEAGLHLDRHILWGEITHPIFQPRTLRPVLLTSKKASIPAYIDLTEWNDPERLTERLGRHITRVETQGNQQTKRPRGRPRKRS